MEKWRNYYSEETIARIHTIELQNLQELDRICKNLNIKFFLYGGTLLGAIKYNGFIPWDDDVDVALIRDDYEKLMQSGNKLIKDDYFFQTIYSEKGTPYPYAKLRKKGTTYIEYGSHRLNINKGIYIDIYPIDNIPDDESEYRKQHKLVQLLTKLFVIRQCPYSSRRESNLKSRIHNIIRYICSHILKICPAEVYYQALKNEMEKYNKKDTHRMSCLFSPNINNYYNCLYPLRKCIFEGENMLVPNDYDGHLKRRYGNYHDEPMEDDRYGHIPYELDLGELRER